MKVAILGTRGIPNYYGGFEQFAEFFSVFLAQNNHDVYVYSSHNHPYKEATFNGVNIIHKYDPEYLIGTAGQFIYDLNCIIDARSRNFDIILQLGYTSNSIWCFLLPKKAIIITNMDGLEWKRTKYSKTVQSLLQYAEKLAVNSSDYLISDSIGIQKYIDKKYNKNSTYIAYGASLFSEPNEQILDHYDVEPQKYNMILARMEPENNIDMILDGVALSENKTIMLVIGNHQTKYGTYLKVKFKNCTNIKFLGGIYNLNHLDNLRYFSKLYFHGHTVGGTNPSLLEAMASGALIAAHQNEFNESILHQNAFYFTTALDIKNILKTTQKQNNTLFISNNFLAIQNLFNWKKINEQYLQLFIACCSKGKIRS
ncbi:MAG: DUF1972 domain-containing protein [Flavobacterium sp.]|nr:DUF1972 domain-containing protein [Flavobacterium sp.]